MTGDVLDGLIDVSGVRSSTREERPLRVEV